MAYNELNNQQRRKIVEACNPSVIFEWEDVELLEILSGNFPELRYGSTNGKSPPSLFGKLKKSYEA